VKEYNSSGTLYQLVQLPEGNFIIKYSMGLSYFYAPFFFIGHLWAKTFHYKVDGFSMPYQVSVFFGCILYSLAGIIFLSKVLKYYFEDKIASLVLILIVFATNYILHVTMQGQNTMSHSLLFFTYSGILWFTIQWHENFKAGNLIALSVFIGLTILARPSEIVCVFIPLLWNVYNRASIHAKWQALRMHWKQFLILVIIIICILSPPFIS
jgi:hypothetical protein